MLFRELAGLRELWLNSTRLRTLPAAALRPLSGLRAFGVTVSPRLRALPEDALRRLAAPRELALHPNRLAALPRALLRGLDPLRRESLRRHRLRARPRALFGSSGSSSSTASWRPCPLTRSRICPGWRKSGSATIPGAATAACPRDAAAPDLAPACRSGRNDPECPDPRGPPPCPAPAATRPALAPAGSEPGVRAQLGARGPRPDHSLFWGLYFLLLATQAVITGIIVFAVVKLGRLFRRLIRERESQRGNLAPN